MIQSHYKWLLALPFLALLFIVLLASYENEKIKLKQRVEHAIEWAKKGLRGKNAMSKLLHDGILRELSEIGENYNKLKAPRIAAAMVVKDKDEGRIVIVGWIEDKPTPTVLELVFSKDNSVFNVPIPELYMRENAKDSSSTVFYSAYAKVEPNTELTKRLDQAEGQENVFMRLVAHDESGSELEKLEFIQR